MAIPGEPYKLVVVESFEPKDRNGRHGKIHVRPVPGQPFPTTLSVECSKRLSTDYPVGTRFRIWAKLTDREGGGQFLYSFHGWKYEVLPPD